MAGPGARDALPGHLMLGAVLPHRSLVVNDEYTWSPALHMMSPSTRPNASLHRGTVSRACGLACAGRRVERAFAHGHEATTGDAKPRPSVIRTLQTKLSVSRKSQDRTAPPHTHFSES
jgi:hypothetical protein